MNKDHVPALLIEYTDPLEGFRGWLVIDSLDHQLCAGGMRVQKGLTAERLIRMARNMTCKMRICGLRIDGAKSGIDYDPAAPGKHAAMARFMAAIKPFIMNKYSMGPDLNVDMAELEAVGASLGLPAVKIAVARAQGWEDCYFLERYNILGREIEGRPLGRLRIGYGVAVAALAVLDFLGIPRSEAGIAVQGFGGLAKAAVFGLTRKGIKIKAIADVERCVIAENGKGLELGELLRTEGTLLPDRGYPAGVRIAPSEEINRVHCDILMPGAVEKTINKEVARDLKIRAVVPGANLAVTEEAREILHERGILVVPDFLSGCGGSLSMEGLFGPEEHPDPQEVLAHVEKRMTRLVTDILVRSRAENITPTRSAERTCAEAVSQPGIRPYGDPRS